MFSILHFILPALFAAVDVVHFCNGKYVCFLQGRAESDNYI